MKRTTKGHTGAEMVSPVFGICKQLGIVESVRSKAISESAHLLTDLPALSQVHVFATDVASANGAAADEMERFPNVMLTPTSALVGGMAHSKPYPLPAFRGHRGRVICLAHSLNLGACVTKPFRILATQRY